MGEDSPEVRKASGPKSSFDRSALPIVVVVIAGTLLVAGVALGESRPTMTGTYSPWFLGLRNAGSFQPASGVYFLKIGVIPEGGLTTQIFGLKISSNSSGDVGVGSAPASCQSPRGSSFTPLTAGNCGAPTGNWYAVLTFSNSTIANVFAAGVGWSGPNLELSSSMAIYVVTAANYTGVGDELTTYGVGGQTVVGGVWL